MITFLIYISALHQFTGDNAVIRSCNLSLKGPVSAWQAPFVSLWWHVTGKRRPHRTRGHTKYTQLCHFLDITNLVPCSCWGDNNVEAAYWVIIWLSRALCPGVATMAQITNNVVRDQAESASLYEYNSNIVNLMNVSLFIFNSKQVTDGRRIVMRMDANFKLINNALKCNTLNPFVQLINFSNLNEKIQLLEFFLLKSASRKNFCQHF